MIYLLNEKEEPEEPVIEIKEENEKEEKLLKVDIKGAINKPGLYEVTSESRVMDVINKAGGLTNNADTEIINLSKKVKDEMVILIYTKEEVQKLKEKEEEPLECPKINDACASENVLEPLIEEEKQNKDNNLKEPDTKISINTASTEDLQTLTGIGEAKAKAIIDYRDKNGKFASIEDLKNVDGIGEALFEKIKDSITI